MNKLTIKEFDEIYDCLMSKNNLSLQRHLIDFPTALKRVKKLGYIKLTELEEAQDLYMKAKNIHSDIGDDWLIKRQDLFCKICRMLFEIIEKKDKK